MRRSSAALAASSAAVIASTALGAGVAGAYVAATAVTPGVSIFSGNEVCTAGFVVRSASGTPGILTAGHCKKDSTVRVQQAGSKPKRVVIGEFERSTFDKPTLDLGWISLKGSSLPIRSAVLGKKAVAGVLTRDELERTKPRLCWQGQKSGLKCSAYKGLDENRAFVGAAPSPGDSGAPVYAVRRDGSVDAVGILLGTTRDDRGLVELIAPRLTDWDLSLVASAR